MNINYMQVIGGHCFTCHEDYKADGYAGDKLHSSCKGGTPTPFSCEKCKKPMTTLEERYYHIVREAILDGHFNDTHGLRSVIAGLLELSKQETHKEIAEQFIHRGWHETNCPAHTNQMGKEEDCDCIFSFILELLTPPKKPDIDKFLADAEKAGEILKEDGKI